MLGKRRLYPSAENFCKVSKFFSFFGKNNGDWELAALPAGIITQRRRGRGGYYYLGMHSGWKGAPHGEHGDTEIFSLRSLCLCVKYLRPDGISVALWSPCEVFRDGLTQRRGGFILSLCDLCASV